MAVMAVGCGGAANFPDEATGNDSRLRAAGTVTSRPTTSSSVATTTRPVVTATTALTAPTTRGGAQPAASRAPTARAATTTINVADQTIVRAAQGPPGGAAAVILQPAPAATLTVEVMEEPGAAANRTALNRVLGDLAKYSGKSVSEIHTALPTGSASRRWTERDLATLADRSAKIPQAGGRFVLRMLFVKGQNTRSPNILAESFRGDTIAAFPDSYSTADQHLITTVVVHEVGHILGLVDLYLNRGRADTLNDPAREGHSRNQASVMYWAVDPSLLGAIFGSASDRFDSEDERDLAAIRAGAARGSNPR